MPDGIMQIETKIFLPNSADPVWISGHFVSNKLVQGYLDGTYTYHGPKNSLNDVIHLFLVSVYARTVSEDECKELDPQW